jgi:predicted metal-dependent phosphoesterase TrpH
MYVPPRAPLSTPRRDYYGRMTTPPSRESTERRYLQGDLQVHTAHGDGMASARELLAHVEEHTDLALLAVTDHDDIEGALVAREEHARGRFHFDLVPGIEVTTRSGHLLALWVDESIPSFKSLEETVARIHRAGGLAVLPHPFSPLTRSVGRRALERVLAIEDTATHPDGIEVANTTLAGTVTRGRPLRLNRERYGLAETGGSDAHFLEGVGSAYTLFEQRAGEAPSDAARRAIEEKSCRGVAGVAPTLRQLGARRLLAQQVRGLSVTPRKVLGPRVRAIAARARHT